MCPPDGRTAPGKGIGQRVALKLECASESARASETWATVHIPELVIQNLHF